MQTCSGVTVAARSFTAAWPKTRFGCQKNIWLNNLEGKGCVLPTHLSGGEEN